MTRHERGEPDFLGGTMRPQLRLARPLRRRASETRTASDPASAGDKQSEHSLLTGGEDAQDTEAGRWFLGQYVTFS